MIGVEFGIRELTLPLFVARVFTDHADHVFTLHDAAAFAEAFDGCSYFHGVKLDSMIRQLGQKTP